MSESTEKLQIATTPIAEQVVANNNISAAETGEASSEVTAAVEASSQSLEEKTPVKRTPSKRRSFIERAQKESEELVKNMGGSLELEGGRRTRSSTRGTPTRPVLNLTPPPTKKARGSPSTTATTPKSARKGGRKIDIATGSPTQKEENKNPDKELAEPEDEGHGTVNDVIKESAVMAKIAKDVANESKDLPDTGSKEENSPEKQQSSVIPVEKVEPVKEAVKIAEQTKEKEQRKSTEITAMKTQEQQVDAKQTEDEDSTASEEAEPVVENQKLEKSDVISIDKSSVTAESSAPEKESTPEPMDIDSSSKSDDVVIVPVESDDNSVNDVQIVNDIEETPATTQGEAAAAVIVAPTVTGPVVEAETVPISTPVAEPAVEPITTNNAIDNKQTKVVETSATKDVVNDIKSTTDLDVANVPIATKDADAEAATAKENDKTEKKNCESKIVNAGESDAKTVTAPQVCN